MDYLENQTRCRYWTIVGNNGFCVTQQECVLVEALRKYYCVTVWELPSFDGALRYAYAAYFNRFIMRNFSLGIAPKIPMNMSEDYVWVDADYEEREGKKPLQVPFVGLPL